MKPVILVVDDNKDMLQVLVDDLGEKYQMHVAFNGKEALELLQKFNVHLVISDVMMPEMDGFEFCSTIKSTIELSHIPIILLTAKNTMQSRIEGLETGADAYIEKPFDTDHLLVQISNLLSNRDKIKSYFLQSPLAHLKSIATSKADEAFMEQLNKIIKENLENIDFDVDTLARRLNMSRTNLFRKIKTVTDLTPNELVNITRLKKAAELLTQGNFKVYEVCDLVGFGTPTNFSRSFLKQFGMTPTEFQKRIQS